MIAEMRNPPKLCSGVSLFGAILLVAVLCQTELRPRTPPIRSRHMQRMRGASKPWLTPSVKEEPT